jgi:hypothetical protein
VNVGMGRDDLSKTNADHHAHGSRARSEVVNRLTVSG